MKGFHVALLLLFCWFRFTCRRFLGLLLRDVYFSAIEVRVGGTKVGVVVERERDYGGVSLVSVAGGGRVRGMGGCSG